jgi:hypothetical protein
MWPYGAQYLTSICMQEGRNKNQQAAPLWEDSYPNYRWYSLTDRGRSFTKWIRNQ